MPKIKQLLTLRLSFFARVEGTLLPPERRRVELKLPTDNTLDRWRTIGRFLLLESAHFVVRRFFGRGEICPMREECGFSLGWRECMEQGQEGIGDSCAHLQILLGLERRRIDQHIPGRLSSYVSLTRTSLPQRQEQEQEEENRMSGVDSEDTDGAELIGTLRRKKEEHGRFEDAWKEKVPHSSRLPIPLHAFSYEQQTMPWRSNQE